MPIRKSYPVTIRPAGLSDAFDSTEAFPGACTSLQNLIFDQSNPECVISRPGVGNAVISASALAAQIGSGTATFISLHVVIGSLVYGMVSMSGGTYAGLDVPFIYNLATAAFVSVTGYTTSNLPASPATSGAWTPPTAAQIGVYLIITHPGFNGTGALFFGAINTATNAWTAQNVGTNALPSAPTAVANFFNRAWYAIGNQAYYSDSLAPLTATNAGQALTVGDGTPILGFAGLPIATSSGGIVAALIVFKQSQIWQITGDAALSVNPLSQNYLSLTQGSSAPRSIAQTQTGVFFVGTDGAMLIDPLGNVNRIRNPQRNVSDIRIPFTNATTPSRIAGGFATNIYRVCVPTIIAGSNVTNDYWFDTTRSRWNGPHNFVYDCASQVATYFLVSGIATGANIFASYPVPQVSSIYSDNGVAVSVLMTTSDFPKTQNMNLFQITEGTQEFSSSGYPVTYFLSMTDSAGNSLAMCTVTTSQTGVAWDGGAVWDGGGVWSNTQIAPSIYQIPWPNPIVANKFILGISATSSSSLMIGAHRSRYQDAGYVATGG